ncbi:MAG: S41 family peptidase [Clostridia bacterium]|nr:S41 family peptidase [Clostridia bacterium]
MDDRLKDIFAEDSTSTLNEKKSGKVSIKVIALVTVIVIVISACAFIGGMVVGRNSGINEDMPLMIETYELIKKYYYKDISWETFQEMAAAGFAGSLDAFSGIVSSDDPTGSSGSIGIQISSSIYNEQIITLVAPNMPAYSARAVNRYDEDNNLDTSFDPVGADVKMREGDKIVCIGYKFVDKEGNEKYITQRVENLTYTYFRSVLNQFSDFKDVVYIIQKYDGNGGYTDGYYAFEITKTYEDTMKYAYYYPYEGDTAIIRMTMFDSEADADFADCVSQFIKDKKKKLILDLRDNGGGQLTSLEYVSQYLLNNPTASQLPIMNLISNVGYGKEQSDIVTSNSTNVLNESLPYAFPICKSVDGFEIVVLTNGNTASASEGLIGALQYYNGTQIVGTTTYGKGVAQRTFELSNGQLLYVTNGRYFIPTRDANGALEWTVTIHEKGFTPLPENVVEDRIADYSIDKCVARAMEIFGY